MKTMWRPRPLNSGSGLIPPGQSAGAEGHLVHPPIPAAGSPLRRGWGQTRGGSPWDKAGSFTGYFVGCSGGGGSPSRWLSHSPPKRERSCNPGAKLSPGRAGRAAPATARPFLPRCKRRERARSRCRGGQRSRTWGGLPASRASRYPSTPRPGHVLVRL